MTYLFILLSQLVLACASEVIEHSPSLELGAVAGSSSVQPLVQDVTFTWVNSNNGTPLSSESSKKKACLRGLVMSIGAGPTCDPANPGNQYACDATTCISYCGVDRWATQCVDGPPWDTARRECQVRPPGGGSASTVGHLRYWTGGTRGDWCEYLNTSFTRVGNAKLSTSTVYFPGSGSMP